ncbi:MAG: nuclear transport factor 2 family protein [Ardenticatenaceae bacterium]|nr:nuclear transport factor 2 family protein [Ardenticatenaceae bacterium]
MKPSAELREHILSLINRSSEKEDKSSQSSPFSQEEGVLVIGTDPDEWWAGYEVITNAFGNEPEISIVDSNPQTYSEGNIGWMADQSKLKFSDGRVIPIRTTSVWRKEEGEWKVVQQHVSVGVPNEQIFDYALPSADTE